MSAGRFHDMGRNDALLLAGGAVGLMLVALVLASTYAAGAPLVPFWTSIAPFPLVIVVFGAGVCRLKHDLTRLGAGPLLRQRIREVPLALAVVVAIILAGVQLNRTPFPAGDPTTIAGEPFLNDHGTYMPITYRQYRHDVALDERSSALILTILLIVGVWTLYPRPTPVADEGVRQRA